MKKGFYSLLLHAHLPFVRHPDHIYFLEENWLFEAISETYIPLLQMFERLVDEGVRFRLAMSLTPPLISMLKDPLLNYRYKRHLEKLIELSEKEVLRTKKNAQLNITASMYLRKFTNYLRYFTDSLKMDIISRFKYFQDIGVLDIVTCTATHAFLPLVKREETIDALLATARDAHRRHLGVDPAGIWLAECGYTPGLEENLHKFGISYFFCEHTCMLYSDPKALYGVYAPLVCSKAPVAAFGRDIESSKQVWHAKIGYPGDVNYREFYRDIGFDMDFDYIKPYIHPDGIRINTGIKYHRITGRTSYKDLYDPFRAIEMASVHAQHFLDQRVYQFERLSGIMDRIPFVFTPFDAELFGHWWYEGPVFLEFLIKKIFYDQDLIEMITPADYLEYYPVNQEAELPYSSWGENAYADFWLDESNSWIYPHLHMMEERIIQLAQHHGSADGVMKRALNQMTRELFLAQSSDWAFIIRNGTAVQYAVKRTKNHINRFNTLYEQVKSKMIDPEYVYELELKDNIFPDADFRYFIPGYKFS